MAASRVLALVRSAGLAKLIPPLSSFEYAVAPLAMDVREIRRPSHHKDRSSSTILLPTPGLETLRSYLRCSGSSPIIHPSDTDASFSLIGDLEADWFSFLGDLDSISAEFVSSLVQGFNLGDLEADWFNFLGDLDSISAEFVSSLGQGFNFDHSEVLIHHWLLMCAPSGSSEEGPSSNGPDDQESDPSDEGPHHGEDKDQKGSEDPGKSKCEKDHMIECDCARIINGSSCLKKCCYDLKFELQKKLFDVNKLKDVLLVQKVTNEAKGDYLDRKILEVQEEMKDLKMLKCLAQLLHSDIEARKLSGERKESSHQEQQNDSQQEQQNESHQQNTKDSQQEEEQKDKDKEEKKWKKSMTARGVLALLVLKRKFPKNPSQAISLYGEYRNYLTALYFLAVCIFVLSQEDLTGLSKQLMIIALYKHHVKKEKQLQEYNETKELANKWWAERQKKDADGFWEKLITG